MESIPKGTTPILVVDDDVGLLTSIKATLVSSGLPEPALVSDSRRVMELVRKHQFNLVLLDLIMDPGMEGLETYKRILKVHPGQKALIASGFSETERVREAQRLGAGAYIKKPYVLERIGLAVRAELER